MSTEIARLDRQEVALQDSWAPAVLEAQVALEKQRRAIMVDYFRSCMQEGHHFYRLPGQEDRKPALSKEGALNICSLYKLVPVPDDPVETWHSDGHYTVRYRTRILSIATGQLVAVGDGMCSTRESKYAYRYASQLCPQCGKAAIIKGREEFGGGWLCFRKKDGCGAKFADGDPQIESQSIGRIPNEDIADQCNTVLKIAEKRSLVDGGLKLPLVSELFTQDLEEQITERQRDTGGLVSRELGLQERETNPTQELPREPVRTSAPENIGPKPTAKEVEDLFALLGKAYTSDERAWVKVREAMSIPSGQECTRARVRLQLTRVQYNQLTSDAKALLRDEINGTDTEDDVKDFSGPEPTQAPSGDALSSDEGSSSPEETTASPEPESHIDHPPVANVSDADIGGPVTRVTSESVMAAGRTAGVIYATDTQKDELKRLSQLISPDEEERTKRSIDKHRRGLPVEVFEMMETALKNRLVQKAAAEA